MVISTKKETKNLEKKRLNDKMYDQKKKKKIIYPSYLKVAIIHIFENTKKKKIQQICH